MIGYIRRGFTLIELLIVVAIIAILAAIAVPNFLEAQTRSKLSRVASDMRTLATALEAYATDNNGRYPRDHDNQSPSGYDRFNFASEVGWYYLTTPIAYITSLALDPFNQENDERGASFYQSTHYILSSGSDNPFCCGAPAAAAYFMNSIGIDQRDQTGDQDRWPTAGRVPLVFYDPTNGTISDGDLYRFGGEYRQGEYFINGRPWPQWGNFGPQSW